MKTIFELIRFKLSDKEKDIKFPLTFFWTDGQTVIFFMNGGGYLRINLVVVEQNDSALEKFIHPMETQGPLPGTENVIEKYYPSADKTVPEATSLDNAILLAMEISCFYQLVVTIPSEERAEPEHKKWFLGLSDEEKLGLEMSPTEAYEDPDFDSLRKVTEEQIQKLQDLRAKETFSEEDLAAAITIFGVV